MITKTIKHFVFRNFTTLFYIGLLVSVSLLLLMARLKLTHSFFYLFLVWNLFLALIPYGISTLLTSRKNLSKVALFTGGFLWLLFLPNAPYLVTDYVHLSVDKSIVSYDAIMISSFVICGLYFYFASLFQMKKILTPITSEKFRKFVFLALPFLVGFGIYLGRFLRWNSWDIIQQPQLLLKDMAALVVFPKEHAIAWIVTLGFGFGLYAVYLILEYFRKKRSNYSTPST